MTRFYLLVLALLFNSLLAVAQSGANDPDFNTQDKGLRYGDGLNGSVSAIAVQPNGKIILGGTFTNYNGKEWKRIARVNADGTPDETFNPGSGANAEITKVKVQSDGKILICGYFSLYNGKNANYLARLNADGSLDESFNFGTGANGLILAIDIQADGKIIIGGQFKTFDGVSRNLLTRLNSNGSSDNTFNIGTGVAGTDPNSLYSVFSISAQSDGKILIGGRFSLFNGVVRNRIARLNSNGSLDSSFDPGNGPSDLVRDFLTQPDGKIIITGNFESYNGVVRAYIARIDGTGILDQTFNPNEGADELIFSSALRTDGKIVIGGNFTSYYGASRSRIAFVNTNGSVNDQFNPGSGFNNTVSAVATQADGKILVGGNFTSLNGKTSPYLDRMNPDGSVDLSFRVVGTGANNGDVAASDMQTDGRIVIGGSFSNYNGTISNKVARLKTDGTLDNTFAVGDGPNGAVTSVKVLPNGKILIGGAFLTFNGADRKRIVRLNADGGIDNTFSLSAGTNGTVTSIAKQNDNKFLIGGLFNTCNGVSRNYIARLNEDGSLDGTFLPGTGPNNYIYSVSIQTDGKILIGGRFTTYNGIARRGIARLNTNGTLDETFNPGAGIIGQLGNVNSIAIHPDGKIYIAGEFYTYNGSPRSCLARLNANGTLDDSFKSTSLVLQSSSANVTLYAISLLADGKILIGGNFSSYEGIARKALARLNADGTLDTSFDTGLGANGIIQTLSIQSDDKVVIGGNFSSYAGIGRNKIARVLKECSGPVTADIAELSSSASVICPGALTTLNVNAGNLSNAAQWKWYSGSCGGTLVGTGTSVQVSPTSTTTYYVRAEGGCVSLGNCSSIIITTSSPEIVASPASRCGEGELKLEVTTATTTSVAWFNSLNGGEAIGSGNSFTTPSIWETTTYYAEASSNGCITPRVPVVATVKSLPVVNVTLTGSTISVTQNFANATYQWINCTNSQPLKGETKKDYSVAEIGAYAVTVTVEGCETTSDCVSALVTGVDEQTKKELRIYPNPVKDVVFVDLGDAYSRLEITDMNGKLIYERSDVKGIQSINLKEHSGIYIMTVLTNSDVRHFKVVIE